MTQILLDPEAPAVSDAKAMSFARANADAKVIKVSSSVVFDAFRVLKAEGEIDTLTIVFQDGEEREVGEFGQLHHWSRDSITDAQMEFTRRIIVRGMKSRKHS